MTKYVRTSLGMCVGCIDDPDADGDCLCAVDMKVCEICGGGPMNDSDPDVCRTCASGTTVGEK